MAPAVRALPALPIPLYQFTNTDLATTGGIPHSRLVVGADGALYGTTSAYGNGNASIGGTIFKINQDGSGFQVLHVFGSIPNDAIMKVQDSDNTLTVGKDHFLYAATQLGGDNAFGALFKVAGDGSGYQIIHSFGGPQNLDQPIFTLVQASDSLLYGMNHSGGIFKIDTNGNNFSILTNALDITSGGLIEGRDGALYGNTAFRVFKINKDGSGFATLHTFTTDEGTNAQSRLIQADDGFLLGTTHNAGDGNVGTIFRLDTNGNNFQVVHQFNDGQIPGDGVAPLAGLSVGIGGFLYGTTQGGPGNTQGGSVFKINQDGTGYQQLCVFTGSIGKTPSATLVQGTAQGTNGAMYGTLAIQGTLQGTIFALLINPPLSITPVVAQSGSQTLLSWPSWALNYVVQTTTNLSSTNWTTVSNGVPVTGMLVTNNDPAVYYRLVLPQ